MRRKVVWAFNVAALWFAAPRVVEAYIGPGAGITVIGTAVAFVGAVILAVVGFVWYPLKRLLAAVRGSGARDDNA
jgi:hypothetical protein